MPQLVGAGILHTKLLVNNATKSLYIGSANMDWRSLTLVKEMGLHFSTCPTLTNDILKIFTSYYIMATPTSVLPNSWPKALATHINQSNPLNINLQGIYSQVYISVSPPQFLTEGRTGDLDAILDIMQKSNKFIYIAVMDYVPGFLYDPSFEYWPTINNEILIRSINHDIEVKLLVSKWQSTRDIEITFLKSLDELRNISNVQIKLFEFPKPIGKKTLVWNKNFPR